MAVVKIPFDNIPSDNIWQTKLMIGDFSAERYMLNPEDKTHSAVAGKMEKLKTEMLEVFNLRNSDV